MVGLYDLKGLFNLNNFMPRRCFLCLTPESSIDDIVRSLGSMNILLEMFNDSDYVSVAPHSAALNVLDLEPRQVREPDWLSRIPRSRQAAGFVVLRTERHVLSHVIK